jgi:pantoate--beta-alanine ligase
VRLILTKAELGQALDDERAAGRTVGLVPTMGALHDGHASLVRRAAEENDVVAVTVFVNPLQFAPTDDLAAYPRDLDGDVAIAEKNGAAYVFAPSVEEMAMGDTLVSVGPLSTALEGESRPGHFDGVATVVATLFHLAGPCRAYFGEKDYQQVAVIRRLVADLSFRVEVVACPIVRDVDGVALSSRNAYLTKDERAAAPVLSRALQAGVATIRAGEREAGTVQALVEAIITAEPLAQLDRVDVVDARTLEPLTALAGDVRLLAAARFGRARLLDNLGVSCDAG